jgi:hypothetical protein
MRSRPQPIADAPSSVGTLVVGVIARIEANGTPYVSLPGVKRPVAARTAVQFAGSEPTTLVGREVLIHVPNDRSKPIISGFVTDSIFSQVVQQAAENAAVRRIEGQKIHFSAQDEITLQCGNSTIILRRDGTVIVRGTDVTSRASRRQKLQGSTVSIN